jgi:hypothetical protein
MDTTDKSNARTTNKLIPLYKQIAQLSLLFIAVLIMLALTAVLVMELIHGTL